MMFTVFNFRAEFICFLRLLRGLGDAEAALYMELWRACAGPLVTVPREQDLVFYFPQGHIEQVCVHTSLKHLCLSDSLHFFYFS